MNKVKTSPHTLPALGLASRGLALFCGGVLLTGWAAGPKSVNLTPQWPVGQRLLSRISLSQTQQISSGPTGQMTQEITQAQDIGLDVRRKLPDGGHELGLTFLAMKMDVAMGGNTIMSYDSQKPGGTTGAAAILGGVMDKVLNAQISMELDPQGQVRKVSGLKEMLDAVAADAPGMGAQMLKGMFNEESVKQMGVLPQGLPARVVQQGETWPYEMDLTLGPLGKLNIAMKFTFTGWEEHDGIPCAVLDYTGALASKPGAQDSPMQVEITGGTMKGRSWFDPKAGLMRETAGTQTMNLKVGALGQNVTMVMDQKVSNKLVGVQPIPQP